MKNMSRDPRVKRASSESCWIEAIDDQWQLPRASYRVQAGEIRLWSKKCELFFGNSEYVTHLELQYFIAMILIVFISPCSIDLLFPDNFGAKVRLKRHSRR